MALVDSLLTAMVRANGDALVMHVGEKPIVVAGPRTMDLSNHGLNLTAMIGMLGQLLPADAQAQLTEFGAVEHVLPTYEGNRFTVVAARSGDDIWIEIRRRRERTVVVVEPEPIVPVADAVVESAPEAEATAAMVTVSEPMAAAEVEPLAEVQPVAEVEPVAQVAHAADEPVAPAADAVAAAGPPTEAEPAITQASVEEPAAEPEPTAPAAEPVPAHVADTPVVEAAHVADATVPMPAPASEPERAPAAEPAPLAAASSESVDVVASEPAAIVANEAVGASAGEPEAAFNVDSRIVAAVDSPDATAEEAVASDAPAHVAAQAEDVVVSAPAEVLHAPPVPDVVAEYAAEEVAVEEVVAGEVVVESVAAEAVAAHDAPVVAPPVAAEPPALVEMAAVAADAAAVARVPEPVAVLAGAGRAVHSLVSGSAMSSMDTAPHSDSVGGGSLPPVAPAAPTMTPPLSDEAPGPVTRTVRIEVPTRAVKATSAERLLRLAGGQGASELFLLSQTRPTVRVDGDIRVLADESPMRAADLEALVAEVTPEPWADAVRRGDPAEWLIEIAEVGRVRCASFRDHRGPGAIFRFAASQAASADQLALDDAARLLATEPDGLVVVAGPAGSDKSAIVGAFVDTINRQRGDYVITLEPQVRVAHDNRHALISQREVGTDAARALAAARGALRENPDVLVIEDLHSGDVAALALAAANDGRLVIVSIEAGSTADAVQRMLQLVADNARGDARAQMARAFRGAIAQQLVRKASGGRVAAREMLAGTQVTARQLAEAPLDRLAETLEAGRDAAHPPLTASLVGYVKTGVVDVREAYRKAPDQPRMLAALKAAGVDTTAVEALV